MAIVAVILNHLNESLLPSGFIGVDVFFVISGYVITRSLERKEPAHSRGAFLAAFYRRRIQRLVPALAVCVVVTALLTCLVVPDPADSLWTGLLALAGGSNLFLFDQATDYFGSSGLLNTFTQTWYLGVDYQFYLIFPLAVWQLGLGRDGAAGRRRFRLGMAVLAALSFLLFLHRRELDPSAAFFLPGPRVWELAVGCLMASPWQGQRLNPAQARAGDWVAWGALSALVGVTLLPQDQGPIPLLVSVAATCALITTLRRESSLGRILTWPPVLRLGLISYSLYLWHWSVIALSRWTVGIHAWSVPVQLLLILGLAEASYRWIETPFGSKPWTADNRRSILIGFGLNAAAAALLLLISDGLGSTLYAGERPATLSEQRQKQRIAGTAITGSDCLVNRKKRLNRRQIAAQFEVCSAAPPSGSGAEARTLFVVGDSHAAALIPLAADLHQSGLGITLLTKAGCPFPATAHGHLDPGCARFQRNVAKQIRAVGRPGDAVLIAGYQLSHLGSGLEASRDGFLDRSGEPVRGSADKTALYTEALGAFSAKAEAAGLQVILIGAGPRLIGRDTCLPEWFRPARWNEICLEALRVEAIDASRMNAQLRQALPAGVRFIDPMRWICPKGCSLADMRKLLADDDHLTDTAVRQLKRPLLDLLSPGETPAPESAANRAD
ncbi:acyltransferase [Synechococcus sp. CS-1329]|nr:acyltransferase [Synechococcus sp. CS-1329]